MALSRSNQPVPLYEQAYQALRNAILRGDFAPGDRLVEHQLAEKLRVSRTPIREAMRQIQRERLAVVDANGGLCVAQLSPADILQLYDCRIALERVSVAGACRNATAAHLQTIDLVLTQIENATQGKLFTLDPARLFELNTRFHRLLAEASGNSWLVMVLDQILDKIILFRVQLLRNSTEIQDIHAEHRQIYEAIARRDTGTAVDAITAHLLADQERGLRLIQNLEQSHA